MPSLNATALEEAGLMESRCPKISVVIPALNEEDVLPACLSSISAQSFPYLYEIIVVDNGSTDSTVSIAKTYCCRVITEPIRDQLLAKKTGVLAAKSNFVVILDADCIAPTDWLLHLYEGLQQQECAAVTACYAFTGLPWWGTIYVFCVSTLLVSLFRVFLRSMPFVIGGNVAFRRDLCIQGGGYPSVGGIAQTELGLARVLNRGGIVRYLPGMQVASSSRRFEQGILYFFWKYKWKDYFVEYISIALKPRTA